MQSPEQTDTIKLEMNKQESKIDYLFYGGHGGNLGHEVPQISPIHCRALTKNGKGPQCHRFAPVGQLYCYQHQKNQRTDTKSVNHNLDQNKQLVVPECKTMQQLLSQNPSRSVWSAILELNQYGKMLLDRLVDKQINKKEFNQLRPECLQGQWQFGMVPYNIRAPNFLCKNACTYCYVGPMFARIGRQCQRVDIEDPMPTDPKLVSQSWTRVKDPDKREMIIFPSSSDIFVENARDYVSVCKKIIDAGHEVSFVSKPTIESMTAIVSELEPLGEPYKSKMVIFVTITTNDDRVLRVFEPYSSLYQERVEVIKFLVERGFDVNIMMEPYLSDPILIAEELKPIIGNGIIVIGGMNNTSRIKFVDDEIKNQELHRYLDYLYQPDNIKKLYEYVRSHDGIYLRYHTVNDVIKACRRWGEFGGTSRPQIPPGGYGGNLGHEVPQIPPK